MVVDFLLVFLGHAILQLIQTKHVRLARTWETLLELFYFFPAYMVNLLLSGIFKDAVRIKVVFLSARLWNFLTKLEILLYSTGRILIMMPIVLGVYGFKNLGVAYAFLWLCFHLAFWLHKSWVFHNFFIPINNLLIELNCHVRLNNLHFPKHFSTYLGSTTDMASLTLFAFFKCAFFEETWTDYGLW